MKTWPITFAVALSSLIAGCSTTTTMTYDLNAPTRTPMQAAAPQALAIHYRLTSVEVPEAIDVASLIVRQPDNSLMVLSHDQWVGSLGESLQSGLTSALTQAVGIPPLPASMLTARDAKDIAAVAVTIEQFDMRPAKQASLGALWQVDFNDQQGQSLTCYSVLTQTVSPGVAALVSAQQRNVAELGQLIANTLKTRQAPPSSNCRPAKTN